MNLFYSKCTHPHNTLVSKLACGQNWNILQTLRIWQLLLKLQGLNWKMQQTLGLKVVFAQKLINMSHYILFLSIQKINVNSSPTLSLKVLSTSAMCSTNVQNSELHFKNNAYTKIPEKIVHSSMSLGGQQFPTHFFHTRVP